MHTVLIFIIFELKKLKNMILLKNLSYSKHFLDIPSRLGRQRKRSISRIGFGPRKKGSQENWPGQSFEKRMLGGAVIHM
jgi:hypothetical protein